MGSLLEGVRVLDLSLQLPGPYATLLLAEHGADVLRIEPPGGDPARAYPALFAAVNQHKRTVEVDLKSADGRAVLDRLVAGADVVVEGFRPGVAQRLGVGYDRVAELRPGVVYCSISGFGQDGPMASEPGHDLTYAAVAGLLSVGGEPPSVPTVPVTDMAAGLYAAFAVAAALTRRAATGQGEHVDVSMADLALTWGIARAAPLLAGERDFLADTPHYGVFRCSDGEWIALGIVHEEHFWTRLCEVLGLPEHLRDTSYEQRLGDPEPLRTQLVEAISRRPRDELVSHLRAADVPAAPVLTPEQAVEVPHFRERGTVHGHGGSTTLGHPARFSTHQPHRSAGRTGAVEVDARSAGWRD